MEFCDGAVDLGLWKSPSAQTHRRTAVRASENVTVSFPAHATDPTRFASGSASYKAATTAYSPSMHGAARVTVLAERPRVVSRPVHERHS